MRSFLKFATKFFALSIAVAAELELEKRDNVTLQVPIIAVPSQHWEGVDGTWSTFEIRVGTPAQTFRVLPATSWQETWVIWEAASGVCNTTQGVPLDCRDLRGSLFESSASSTWQNETQNYLGLNEAMGYSGVGQYGFDTVGLGYTDSDGPTLKHQIVAEIFSDTWWFGMLGLGFQPTNFSTYGNPQASFTDTLSSNGTISSRSWSYTAGAYYRLKGVFGSLIFGGCDASKFTPNNVIFKMTGDNLRDIVVTVRSITSATTTGNTTLMSTPEFAFIDSTVPEIWLPTEACKQFETAFGLTLDETSELYLINASTHANLQKLNPNITFTLANQKAGGPTTDIVLPYASFDLNITAPLLPNRSSLYFPIRQTDNSNMYTLGRTFLQEAYVVTHYNSRTFNVSQCVFDDSLPPNVLALPPDLSNPTTISSPTASSTPKAKSKKKLPGGAIAGIVIGALLGIACVGLAAALLIIRRRRSKNKTEKPSTPVHEIDTGKRIEHPDSSAYTAQASAYTSEVNGNDAKVEIQGNPIMHPQELEAEVPILSGNHRTGRVSGPSDSSRGTENTGVSSLSPIIEPGRTPMVEMGVDERGLGEVPREADDDDHIISPNSDTMPSMMERKRGAPDIRISSPSVSEAGWSPTTPLSRRGSRFQERWS